MSECCFDIKVFLLEYSTEMEILMKKVLITGNYRICRKSFDGLFITKHRL